MKYSRESEKRYRDFLENLNDIAYETDKLGNVTYCNKIAEEFVGVTKEKIIGHNFLPFFSEEDGKLAIEKAKEFSPDIILLDLKMPVMNGFEAIEEMRKDRIDTAPEHAAGVETMRAYWHLGKAVNDIARWLRKRGIRCQPNHPLDGLTVTPPLAGKAGLGWQNQFGLLITPEFGVRQRIAPIFIDKQHFKVTDSLEHEWIEEYCSTCGICIEECPTEAINEKRVPYLEGVETIGALKSCIDRPKCYPYFLETTGCSVCVKVCPFSRGGGVYDELKSQFHKKK